MEHKDAANEAAFQKAAELLGKPLELPLGRGEPGSGDDFRRLATQHAFGDSWSRPGLDTRSRALVSLMTAHLTVEQRQLARRLCAKGLSLREIGRQVGCSHEVVRTVVRRESKPARAVRLVAARARTADPG